MRSLKYVSKKLKRKVRLASKETLKKIDGNRDISSGTLTYTTRVGVVYVKTNKSINSITNIIMSSKKPNRLKLIRGKKKKLATEKSYLKISSFKTKSYKVKNGEIKFSVNQSFINKRNLSRMKHARPKISLKGIVKGAPRFVGNVAYSSVNNIGNGLIRTNNTSIKSVGVLVKSSAKTTKFLVKLPGRVYRIPSNLKTVTKKINKTRNAVAHKSKSMRRVVSNISKGSYSKKILRSKLKKTTQKTVKTAGKASLKFVINLVRKIGLKILLPAIAIGVGLVIIINVMSAPMDGVISLLSGQYTNALTHKDEDIKEYLSGYVENKRNALIDKILNYGNYTRHTYVSTEITINSEESNVLVKRESISNAIYTTEEMVNLIEPFLNTVLVEKYGLEATPSQLNKITDELWDKLVKISFKEIPVAFRQHKIVSWKLEVRIDLDGYYELLSQYYIEPIERLSNKRRTEQEDKDLINLKDSYDMCLLYMDFIMADDNTNADSDIDNFVSKTGTRKGNNGMPTYAKSFIGNVGGRQFWSWYGFQSRVEWCAIFVSYCAANTGNGYKIPRFASCRVGANYFKMHEQWTSSSAYIPAAGDIIFFDWERDGQPNHVGIVIGSDGEKVYTIEGNSGDACRRRSYSLHSSVIYGYGLPNY